MKTFIKIVCYLILLVSGLTDMYYMTIPIALITLSIIGYIEITTVIDDARIKPVRRRRKKKKNAPLGYIK